MLLDPTGGFCLAVKVPKEARFVIRPGNLHAPPVTSTRLQFGHLKAPRRGNVFRPATLRRFCVPSDPTLRNWPCLFAASVGYTTFLTFMTPQIPNKQQTNIKQKTNNHPVLNAAKAARGPTSVGSAS